MEFFKIKKFRKPHKPDPEKDSENNKPVPPPEEGEPKNENGNGGDSDKSPKVEPFNDVEDDDDDFITNEVKRRLKELRRNSFMVLIPEEESCNEEEEDEEEEKAETSSTEWRDVEAEGRRWWGGFDAVYEKYCERMLFFDRMSSQQLNQAGSQTPTTPSPRSASKKLSSPFRCLSLKKIEEPEEETEHLQPQNNDPYQDLETAYVAQLCLGWEALHCQYTQLSQKISSQPDDPTCYNLSAQELQQFQVLLQRLIENEPFEQGQRPEIYARTRHAFPKLLQVPNIKGAAQEQENGEEESDMVVRASDMMRIIESVILGLRLFIKMDKTKSSGGHNLFGNQSHMATPINQIQSSLQKKSMRLKELRKRKKGWKTKSFPRAWEDIELLFGLIDVKLMSRVLKMVRVTKEQLFWCEEKMKKLDLSDGKLQRDPSPIIFPC